MTEHEHVPAATELVYAPRPSWGPAFFAVGLAFAVCGIFASGFLVPSYVYSLIGLVVLAAAVRSLVAGTVRDFFGLPREQRVRGAVLPAASLRALPRDRDRT